MKMDGIEETCSKIGGPNKNGGICSWIEIVGELEFINSGHLGQVLWLLPSLYLSRVVQEKAVLEF